MECPQCKVEIPASAGVCPSCGKPAQESKAPSELPTATRQKPDGLEAYNTVAETVGFIPSLRLKDNVLQGIIVGVGTLLGAGIGFLLARHLGGPVLRGIRGLVAAVFLLGGTVLGGILGLMASAFLSGLVLMILGFVRAAKKK